MKLTPTGHLQTDLPEPTKENNFKLKLNPPVFEDVTKETRERYAKSNKFNRFSSTVEKVL